MSVTRVFRLPGRPEREQARNDATAVVDNPLLRPDVTDDLGAFDARDLFMRHWKIIKKALKTHTKQGVLMFAFDSGKNALGQAWLAATLDRTRAAIFGRHSMCNLAVPEHYERISLRHLAILVRAKSHDEVRVRVIDLHTQTGFYDESGRVLQAATAEGSIFLRIGGVFLIVLVTGEHPEIPDDPEAAYGWIPERVFIDEREGTAGAPVAKMIMPRERHQPGMTIVRSQMGPLAAAGNLCGEDEVPIAEMVVRSSGGSVRRPVGASILERGLLVGRYARCDIGLAVHDDSRLSRVHLLVVKDGEDIIAVDAASMNGTYVSDRAILLHSLVDGTVLDLGGELEITWHVA
jgi:hypothetical protein